MERQKFHLIHVPLRFLITYTSVIPRSQQACGLQLRLGRNNCLRDAPPLPAQHVDVLREEALCRHLAADRRRARRPHVRPGTSRRVSAATVQTRWSEQAALSHQPAKTKSGTVRASAAGATARPAALAVSTSRCSRVWMANWQRTRWSLQCRSRSRRKIQTLVTNCRRSISRKRSRRTPHFRLAAASDFIPFSERLSSMVRLVSCCGTSRAVNALSYAKRWRASTRFPP